MEKKFENKPENKPEKKPEKIFEHKEFFKGSVRTLKDAIELHVVLTVDNMRNCRQLRTLIDMAYHLGLISNSDRLLYTSQLDGFSEYCDFLY